MKCPFELPVETNQVPNALLQGLRKPINIIQGSINDRGVRKIYAFCDDKEQADYIVQAINSYEKLAERYKDYEKLWELAVQDNCNGDCDLEPPHKRCPECLASSAINTLGEMRGQFIDEIEQALNQAEKE